MSIDTRSFRRTAAITAASAITAITTTIAVQPATATEPPSDRPCFIAQPRWNTAIDGPPPTCPIPSWQRVTESRAGTEPQPAGSGTSNRMDFGDEFADPPRR